MGSVACLAHRSSGVGGQVIPLWPECKDQVAAILTRASEGILCAAPGDAERIEEVRGSEAGKRREVEVEVLTETETAV